MGISKRKVISDSLFLTGGDLLLKLKGVIFLPIIISYAGMQNYGAFVQIMINAAMVGPFCTLELGMAFYRYTSKYDNTQTHALGRDYWTVCITVFILSLLGALSIFLVSPVVSKHILAGTSLNSLRLSSLLVICSGINHVNIKYIQARRKFKLFSIYSLLHGLLPYLGFVAGVMLSSQIFLGLLLYLIINSVLILSLLLYVITGVGFSRPSIKVLKQFVKYSWALLFSSLGGGLLSKVDRYFIGYFIGPVAIGMYNIVYSVCSLLHTLTVPFRKHFAVYLPKIWDEGRQSKVRNYLKEGLVYYLVISIACLVFITFLLKPAITLILSKDFSIIANFEWLILVTGLGIIALGVVEFFWRLAECREQNYLMLCFQLIAVALNFSLNYFLVKQYGIMGAGIATLASYLAILAMSNYYFDMNLDLRFSTKVLRIGIAALVIGLWFYFHPVDGLFDLGINIVVGLAIYLFLVLLLRVIRFEEVKQRFA